MTRSLILLTKDGQSAALWLAFNPFLTLLGKIAWMMLVIPGRILPRIGRRTVGVLSFPIAGFRPFLLPCQPYRSDSSSHMFGALTTTRWVVTSKVLGNLLVDGRVLPIVFEAHPPPTPTLAQSAPAGVVEVSLKHHECAVSEPIIHSGSRTKQLHFIIFPGSETLVAKFC